MNNMSMIDRIVAILENLNDVFIKGES